MRPLQGPRPSRQDVVLAAAVGGALVIEAILRDGDALRGATACAIGLLLVWRRRTPVLTAAAVVALALAGPGNADATLTILPFLVVLYSCGHEAPPGWAAAVACGSAVALVATDPGDTAGVGETLGNLLYYLLLSSGPVVAGVIVRQHRARARHLARIADDLDRDRETRAREAVDAERRRIARELHDVVAHAVNVVAVHAAVARTAQGDEGRERALGRIEDAAEQASAEMRRLLGVLRDDARAGALPGLSALGDLVAEARAVGADVEVTVDGVPRELPAGVDLAAYRIVQEALTNARKHAPSAPARVRVTYAPDEVRIRVSNDLVASAGAGGAGHGLVGMRERCHLYDGSLRAGEVDGRFEVDARLPVAGGVSGAVAVPAAG